MCAVLGNMPINHSGQTIQLHTDLLLLLDVLLTRAIKQPVYLQRDVYARYQFEAQSQYLRHFWRVSVVNA